MFLKKIKLMSNKKKIIITIGLIILGVLIFFVFGFCNKGIGMNKNLKCKLIESALNDKDYKLANMLNNDYLKKSDKKDYDYYKSCIDKCMVLDETYTYLKTAMKNITCSESAVFEKIKYLHSLKGVVMVNNNNEDLLVTGTVKITFKNIDDRIVYETDELYSCKPNEKCEVPLLVDDIYKDCKTEVSFNDDIVLAKNK